MNFRITKASEYKFEEEMTIKTLEDLLDFTDKTKDQSIILSRDWKNPENYHITIYDDYVE